MRSVTLSESLRPWAFAGITAFLAEEEVNLYLPEQATPKPHAATPQRAYPQAREALSSPGTFSPPRPSANSAGTPSENATKSPSAVVAASSGATPPARPVNALVAPSGVQAPPPATSEAPWPSAFTALFSKLTPGPVLWTYADLGADLSGQGSAERSAFLRVLIQRLHLPKGTSNFWPYSLPGETPAEQGYAVFHQGTVHLRPKLIIIIGVSALCAFEGKVSLDLPFTQQLYQGRMHILLPEFTELLANPSLLERSCHYLRATLTALGVYSSNT